MEQKRFDLRSLSPALRNLWLLLVVFINTKTITVFCLFQQIQCEVKAKYTTMKANPWSEPMSLLRPFFAGIKVKKLLFVEIPVQILLLKE